VILGLDTATADTAVALWAPGGPEVERRDEPPLGARPAHAGKLLQLVEEVLDAAGAGWDNVERIAVGVGPGSFTGLRIGIATARGLAQARNLPLIGVSSLTALAKGVRPPYAEGAKGVRPPYPGGVRPPYVVAVIDARRGEVFAEAPGEFGPAAMSPEELAARIHSGSLTVGDGAVRFREPLERAGAAIPADDSPLHRISALTVCRLGAKGEPAARDALLPDYRREPDAKPQQP
jgi:tRNA threonylcarbamoyladenosine biosynthesis protein TsaB